MKQTDENAVIVLRRLREHFKDDAIGREVLSYTINRLKGLIENPTVEQKHGHWEWQKEDIYRCSECGSIDRDIGIPKFCRICGSKNSMKD